MLNIKKINTNDSQLLLIGDVHGKVELYNNALRLAQKKHSSFLSIQVGDFGFIEAHDRAFGKTQIKNNYFVLFGNHDHYPYINKYYSLGDVALIQTPNSKIMCIRGANSIDKLLQLQRGTWFEEEELTIQQAYELVDLYDSFKPDIVVSHDCPQSVRCTLFNINESSRTSQMLESLLCIHQPSHWYFGHHHKQIQREISGVHFRCLSELESVFVSV